MGGAMADSDNFDSDFEEEGEYFRDTVRPNIKIRIDEYLTTAKLGRMAYVAGDIQLAKDRFNLAMDLEFLTEIESTSDFGVTGGLLREELLARHEEMYDNKLMKPSDRLVNFLSSLEKIFTTADEKAAFNTADTKSFLLMGAALSVVGEWDKAEKVYKEGIAASSTESQLLESALKRLNKLQDMMNLAGNETKPNNTGTPPRSPKTSRRPISQLFEHSNVCRSQSFSSDLAKLLKPSSPMKENPHSPTVPSPLATLPSPSTPRKSILKLFRREKRPKSQFFGNGMSLSQSSEDISDLGIWRERSSWGHVFDPMHCTQTVQDFDSRTIQTMRLMDYLTSHSEDNTGCTSSPK